MLRPELLQLQERNPRLRLFFTLTRESSQEWEGLTGRIGQGLLEQLGLPQVADDVFVWQVGPSEFGKDISD